MSKRFLLSAGLLFAVLVLTSTASWSVEPLMIGVIDAKRCIEESEAGKKILFSLQGKSERIKKEMEARKEEIKTLREDLLKKSNIVTADVKREKEKELVRQEEDFRDIVRGKEAEFQKEQRDAFQDLSNQLFEVATAMGQQEGYTLILEAKSGIVYHINAIDLTDKVIKTFNANKEKR